MSIIFCETKGKFDMLFFNFKTLQSKEDIICKFKCLKALEPHKMIFDLFDSFNDYRIGLHTYVNGNIVKGYYEDGGLNRVGSLANGKIWFYGKLVERKGICQFKGIIFSAFIPVELSVLIPALYQRNLIWSIISLGYMTYEMYHEEKPVYRCLTEILS